MVADVTIHAPHPEGDERNYHAHVLLTLREIGPDGFGEKAREWNDKKLNLQWREKWAELDACQLEKASYQQEAERYSYGHFDKPKQRSIALERGDLEHAKALEGEATKHMGPHAAAMERKGKETERGAANREISSAAGGTASLKKELEQIEKELAAAEREDRVAPQKPAPPVMPSNLRGTAAETRTAYNAKENFVSGRDPYQFAFALEKKGIYMKIYPLPNSKVGCGQKRKKSGCYLQKTRMFISTKTF